ncbi:proline-rich protein 36-like [Sebastes umbrosus]|uniref:proline-rich protein 36-like n=1 Tax=Sebastes umbrosus TaxID=72105 RepID=UPI00189E8F2D|nr:proline-rich protein 36-like [Sebastes umbrosus]
MPPKKGDSKSAAKKGKSEEPKKGGKDDKKGGKDDKKGGKKAEEPPAKGKGKDDGKKGKGKKPVSESEEGSEEEEEEMKTEEEEDEDSEEEVVTKKAKGKAALKGASKAMAVKGFKPPKHPPPSDDEEEEEPTGKAQMKKGMGAVNLKKMSGVNIKGASKAMAGFAAEGQKKSASAAKPQKTLDARSHLKGASKALSGIAGKSSPFSFPSKQPAEKAKPKRNLKSTSRLFLRISKKKKNPGGGKPLLGTSKLFAGFGGKSADKKPGLSGFGMFNKKSDTPKETTPPKKTINLSGLGAKGGKMASEAKGLGGKFKGMFGKKKTGLGFKTKSWMLGRMAAASNWLTGRFLSTKGHGQLGARVGRRGQKNLSFANRDTRGRQTHYYNEAYEYDDEYGYEEDYHNRERPRGYLRQPMAYDPYDPYGEELEYYDDDEWEDEYGYYDDEGNFYYDDELYYEDDVDYYGYPYGYYDDEYEDYDGDEGMEYYYGEDGMLYAVEPEPYGYYGNAVDGFYDPYDPELYGDYVDNNMGYDYGMSNPYGMMSDGYDVVSDLYNDPMLGYTDPAAIYNPYQQPFYMDAGLVPAETGQLYGQEQLSYPLAEPFSAAQFRVPRPQVMLFGKDRLEVETLPPPPPLYPHPSSPMFPPPSPALDLNNLDMMSDIQYEQPLPAYLPAQPYYSTVMNQQQSPILRRQAPSPTAMMIQQEHFSLPQPIHPPFSVSLSHMSPSPLPPQLASQVYQPSFPQDPQMLQMGYMSPMVAQIQPPMPPLMHSPLHSPLASPRLVRRMSPLPSPQLSLRQGSVRAMAPPSPRLLPHHMDFQTGIQPDPYLSPRLHRRGPSHRASMAGQMSTSQRRRPPSSPASPSHQRRGMSIRAQPSLSRGRGGVGLRRAPSTVRPQSPLSSPLASSRGSLRKRASPPPSPRLSFRQQPPPDAVPLPSTRPHLFKGRKQTSKLRHSPSPPLPSPQRRSPPLPERSQSPRQTFRPTSPHRPPSPSPSRVTSRPLPTRTSTRRLRGGAGGRSHVPMGAVKPSPANPYSQRRSRHGPPVTQHVAPFRSSIHSGPAPSSGQMGGVGGTPMLARAGSRPTGLRESKRIGTPQGGFHRPVGRGQPLVRMPRNQSSLQSRQSFRAPPPGLPVSPQPSLKHSGPLSPQPSVRRLQSRPPSPQPLQRRSPLPSRSASPNHYMSHPPSPFPHRAMSPQSLGPTSFQPPVPHPGLPHGTLQPSQSITHYDYTMMEPGPSPMLTNALPNPQVVGAAFPHYPLPSSIPYSTTAYSSPLQRPSSPQPQYEVYPQNLPQPAPSSPYLGHALQNPYLQNASYTTPLQRGPSPIPVGQGEILADAQVSQEGSPYASLGLSNALMQNSRLRSASYSSPLQRNANVYTNVFSPPQEAALPAPSVPYSSHLSSAMLNSQLRNASYASPLQRHLSPMSPASPAPPPTIPQQGSSSFLSGGLRTSQIQGSMLKLPAGTLKMSRGPVESPITTDGSGGRLSPSVLSNALQNPSLRQATYRLPDGSLVTRTEPSPAPSPLSSSMLSSALLNPSLRQATYRLPDGSLATRSEPAEPSPAPSPLSSSMLSSALLNPSLRQATYRLPDGSLVTRTEPAEPSPAPSPLSSSMLSSALLNPSLRKATYRLPDGTLVTRTEPAEPSPAPSPLSSSMLSSALLNPSLRKATYRLPDGSLVTRTEPTPAPSPSMLSSALLNPNVRKATYRLPDGTLVTRNEPAPEPVTPSSSMLSSALLNPNVRKASYRLPDGSFLTHPVEENAESAISSPGLSGALMNANLRKAKFQLPEGSSLFSRNQASTSASSGPNLSGAMLNTDLRGASYRLPGTSLLRQPGSADPAESRSLDLSNALSNKNLRSATYRLPDGTLMTRPQPTASPRTLDLSNALSKNPNLRGANYRPPGGNIMSRLGAPSTPEPRSLNLSGALQNAHLKGASFRLPSYAVVSPQVQGSGPGQHWAEGSGVEGLGLQQDVDVWGAERVLPHGTVQNLNKWSMYRDGELLDPYSLMGQGPVGHEPGEWNLSREGEPQGHWYDKVKVLNT